MSNLPSVIQGRKESVWLAGVRQEAWQRYETMSWPTPENEEWRRTDITAFEFDRYQFLWFRSGCQGQLYYGNPLRRSCGQLFRDPNSWHSAIDC